MMCITDFLSFVHHFKNLNPKSPERSHLRITYEKNVKEVGVCSEIPKMNINNTSGRSSI